MEQSGKRKQKLRTEEIVGMRTGMQLNMGTEITAKTEQTMEIIPIMRG